MALKFVPHPRYLLGLAAAYGAVACLFGAVFLLIVALIARPGPTASFLAGVATGILAMYYTGRPLRFFALRWWSSLHSSPSHRFDQAT